MGNPLLVHIEEKPVTKIEKVFTLKFTEKEIRTICCAFDSLDVGDIANSANTLNIEESDVISIPNELDGLTRNIKSLVDVK